jgi:hypothetical protein
VGGLEEELAATWLSSLVPVGAPCDVQVAPSADIQIIGCSKASSVPTAMSTPFSAITWLTKPRPGVLLSSVQLSPSAERQVPSLAMA